MKFKISDIILFVIVNISLYGCHEANRKNINRLLRIDTLIPTQPSAALDSLRNFKINNLSRHDLDYYHLLHTIAYDKAGYNAESDKIITSVVKSYQHLSKKEPRNYARALMYQGLVRHRLGKSDSTVYFPIKKAADILETLKPYDANNIYLCYYYLGTIHDENNSVSLSFKYFNDALKLSQKINNTEYIIDAYLSLFWNRIRTADYKKAKIYAGFLEKFNNLSLLKQSDIYTAITTYYEKLGEFEKALPLEYDLLKIDIARADTANIISGYFRISDNYKNQNKLDSALKYSELVIKYINKNNPNNLNYFYYFNVAQIAEKNNKLSKSIEAYKNAFHLQQKSIDTKLNTKILELEKKYDLSELQRKEQKTRSLSYIYLSMTLILILALIIFSLLRKQSVVEEQTKTRELMKEIEIQKHKNENVRRETAEKLWINKLYQYVSEQNKETHELLYKLKNNKYLEGNEKIVHLIQETTDIYSKGIKKMSIKMMDETMFLNFTGMSLIQSKLFNESEKLLLVLTLCKMDYKQIATLIDSSYDSVRVRKRLLLEKLENNGINIPNLLLNLENLL